MLASSPRSKLGVSKADPNTTVEYTFVEPLGLKYQCLICTSHLKEPHLTECCGHHFCVACLHNWEKSDKHNTCPHCRAKGYAHIHDKPLQREINQLRVYCSPPSRRNGCEWQGELSKLEEHLKVCEFVQIKCKKCAEPLLRKGENVHLEKVCKMRDTKCQYCQQTGPYIEIVSFTHMSTCMSYPIHCPSGCSTNKFVRSELDKHLETCPNVVVNCPFEEAGCTVKLQRKDVDSHLSTATSLHLSCMMGAFKKQSAQVRKLTRFKETMEASVVKVCTEVDKISSTGNQLLALKTALSVFPLQWLSPENSKISIQLSQHKPKSSPTGCTIQQTSVHYQSRPFYINEGYKFKLNATIGQHRKSNSISLSIIPGEHDQKLKWPPSIDFGSITLKVPGDSTQTNLGSKNCELPLSVKTLDKGPFKVCEDCQVLVLCRTVTDITVTLQYGDTFEDPLPEMTHLAIRGRKRKYV